MNNQLMPIPPPNEPKTVGSNDLPRFNIDLVLRKKKIGVIEAIGFNPDGNFPTIVFSGKLLHQLDDPKALVVLLQKEGIHLGESIVK